MKNTKRMLLVGILIAILIIVSFYFDSEIVREVSKIRNVFLDDVFLGITTISSGIIIFFFLTSLFLWREHKRKWILPLWFTLVLSVVVSFVLKICVQRLRPFQKGLVDIFPLLEKNSYLLWNFSFPSFQAMLAFCAVPILSKEFPKFKYIWIVIAVLIAFSRLYFGVHFLSDILVGGVVGYLIGVLVIELEKENMFWEKIYKKIFKRN